MYNQDHIINVSVNYLYINYRQIIDIVIVSLNRYWYIL